MRFKGIVSIIFALQAGVFFACGESPNDDLDTGAGGDTDTDTDTDTNAEPDTGPDGGVDSGPDSAVDPELPEAFVGADSVEMTMGAVWGADMCDAGTASVLKATAVNGKIRVLFEGCFPCEVVKHEAFVKQTDDGYEILFRPPALEDHNACGEHIYDMRLMAGPGAVGDTITVFVQPSRDEAPVQKAETEVSADPEDCDNLTACSLDSPCSNNGVAMDERPGDEYRMGCAALESCGGSFCIWDQEACMMECGTADCITLDTDPTLPSCE